jgi:hypothetical protein
VKGRQTKPPALKFLATGSRQESARKSGEKTHSSARRPAREPTAFVKVRIRSKRMLIFKVKFEPREKREKERKKFAFHSCETCK